MSLQFEKKYKRKPDENLGRIANLSEVATFSGPEVIAVMVLRSDGYVDIYDNTSKPLRDRPLRDGKGDVHPGAPKEPLGHEEPYGVQTSHIVTMVGSPGCICINGTRYYW